MKETTGFSDQTQEKDLNDPGKPERLGDINDLLKDVDEVEQKVNKKREEPEKPKKRRGRPKKADVEAEKNAEKEMVTALMQQAGANALVSVFKLIDALVKKRLPTWESLNKTELTELSNATNAVVIKYLPDIAGKAEEFGLALVLFAIVGKRLPALTTEKKTND